jgi:hypothetical protein
MMKRLVAIILSGAILMIIGAISVWAQQPCLVPSLASATIVQTLTPQEPSARAWNTAVGQLAGLIGGFAGIFLTAANLTPSFMDHHDLTFARVGAAGVAVIITAGIQVLLKAISPAGAATALVLAVGAESASLTGAARLIVGIILVTLLGEAARLGLLRVS